MTKKNIFLINKQSARIYNFNKNNLSNIDEEKIISSVQSEKATQILNSMSTISSNITDPYIDTTSNTLSFCLPYTRDKNDIINVYKNNVLNTTFTFDKVSRTMTILLSWDESTYSISKEDTLEYVSIYIETEIFGTKINYTLHP